MASSGSVNFTATRNQIIRAAALKIGAISAGVAMGHQMQSDFAFQLNAMVKRWQASGIHVWTTREAVLFPDPGQVEYSLGLTSTDHVSESYATAEISADEAAGQTTLSVEDTSSIAVSDYIGINVSDGTLFWSTVSSKTSSTVTIAAALPESAPEGSAVFAYTTKIVRPLKVIDARRYNITSGTDTPLVMTPRLDYRALPNKATAGQINQVFYDPQLTLGKLYIWQTPTAVTDLVKFTWHRPIEDFDSAGDNPDMPQEWIDALIYNLAVAMAPDFTVATEKFLQVKMLADEYLGQVKDFDREEGSVFFQPDFSGVRVRSGQLMDIVFALQSYKSDSLPVSAQRAVNCYAEFQSPGAKKEAVIFGQPGVGTFATCGRGPVRGFYEMNGVLYVVSRDSFYSVDEDGVETLLGTGIGGLAPVSIDGNGIEVVIVNGTDGFIYTPSSGVFATISDNDFNAAQSVTFIDSYFAFDWKDTNKFFLSDILDGATYPSLSFASAESSPDRVLAVLNYQGALLIFGERTIEAWDHTGATSFPFQRFDGSTIQRGIIAPAALTREGIAVYFLGDDRNFYRLVGNQSQRISTHAIEKEWEGYATVSDAFCFTVPYGGHKFIYVTFPTEGKTWGFDVVTGLWHERLSWDSTGAEVKWRVNCAVKAYSKVLVGDANSGKIGFLDASLYTEFGDPIRMILVSPPIHSEGRRMFMPMFELDMETGIGTTTGQGSNPQAMLDWSDDGGHTWVSPQTWTGIGKIGTYLTRMQWDRLGSFYQRSMRVQISDPVKRVVLGARAPRLSIGME